MSYELNFSLSLGAGKAGLADLRAQLVDSSGVNSGTAISTGFVEIGSGHYLRNHTGFADGFRGGVKFYSNAAPAALLVFAAINPEEAENSDAKTSSRLAASSYTAPPSAAAIDTQLSGVHGAGSWTTATGFSTLTTTDIDNRLAAYDAATGTEAAAILAAIAALNNLSSAGAQAAAAAALAAYNAATGDDVASVAATVAASNPASADSATINIHAASSYSGTLTGLTIPVSWTSVALTMKRKTAHADSKAVLQIIKTNGGDVGDGLTILNGSTSTTKADASLSVNQGAGSIAVTIADAATAALAVESYRYDVKVYYGDSDSVATAEATANVTSAVTLAT